MNEDPNNGYEGYLTLGRFLESDGWHPQPIDGETAYRLGFQGANGRADCVAIILEEQQQLVFYAEAPIPVEEPRRMEMARFIALANFGMRIGNFEMDLGTGQVRYKSSLDFEGMILTPRMIGNAIYPAAHTLDEYLPGLLAVCAGASAEDGIRTVEG